MKILVTGANGYIGHNVVSYLCNKYFKDTIIACDFNDSKIDKRARFLNINLLEKADNTNLFRMLDEPDACIHLAWQDGFNHMADSHLQNLSAHFHFLKNMIDSGCKNISVMGTMHEIGYYEGEVDARTPCNPLSMYGIAKNALRQSVFAYIENKTVFFKWLRAYYITGDDKNNKSIFAKILQMSDEGKNSFPFTSGLNKYDFIDVKLLAQYIAEASVQTSVNGIINVCSGEPVALKDKVEQFIKENKLQIKPEFGAFPSRKYDSPAIWGNPDLITKIMMDVKNNMY